MDEKLCPRCKKNYLESEESLNALSRRDNDTRICNPCGIEEALSDFLGIKEDLSWLEEVHAE